MAVVPPIGINQTPCIGDTLYDYSTGEWWTSKFDEDEPLPGILVIKKA